MIDEYDPIYFAEALALQSCDILLPLIGIDGAIAGRYRSIWRQLLTTSLEYPDFLREPKRVAEDASVLIAEMDKELGSDCTYRSWMTCFAGAPAWGRRDGRWIEAIATHFGNRQDDQASAEDTYKWAPPSIRRQTIAEARLHLHDTWDLNEVRRWAGETWPLGPSPFDYVEDAILRADVVRAVAYLEHNGELPSFIRSNNLSSEPRPNSTICFSS